MRDSTPGKDFACRYKEASLKNDHVIGTLPAHRADDAFHVGSLPGRSRRRTYLFHSQIGNLLPKLAAKYAIPVAEQILRSLIERKCFPQLLCRPLGRRM